MKLIALLILSSVAAIAQTSVSSGGTSVIGAPSGGNGTGSIVGGLCNGIQFQRGLNSDGTPICAATPAATVSAAGLAAITNNVVADPLATGGGNNALANAITTYPGGGSLIVSPGYALTEISNYLTPSIYGNNDQYAQYPLSGGASPAWYAEDQRGRNRLFEFVNPIPISPVGAYNNRTPAAIEARFSHSINYADNFNALLLKLRIAGGSDNYGLSFANQKSNFAILTLDGEVRAPGQGGGTIDDTLSHPAPGDDMAITIQHQTNGCSEGEDECDKLFRAFLETMTARFGGTLKAAPLLDSAGFGNYALDVNVGNGYSAKASAEGVWLVNLQRPYTAGNVTSMLTSAKSGMGLFTSDSAAAWTAQFGTSTFTTLTAAVDNTPYSGCTQTSTTPISPDPMITTEAGIGGLAARCVGVGSSAGMAAGTILRIMGFHGNFEDVRVVSVPDATHVVANVQKYHEIGENVAFGGMSQKGISMIADDIAPGGIANYHIQPTTTLHKVIPLLGNDSSGAYVYLNSANVAEVSTNAYVKTTPNSFATVSGVTMSGAAVQSVNLSSAGDYNVSGSIVAQGQSTLAVPTVTFSGGPCSTQPTAHGVYNYASNQQQLSVVIDGGGVCTGTPTATLSTTWPNPYRVVDLAFTRKVINPATGSVNDGHLLVSALTPANWQTGDLVEMPGYIHDFQGNTRVQGKYYTGKSGKNGISDAQYFEGDWAYPDVLKGILNTTDGHKYYTDPTHPLGPGIAYETPPNGFGVAGDVGVAFPIYNPPAKAVFSVGCAATVAGNVTFHPCQNGVTSPYDLWNNTDITTNTTNPHHLNFDGIAGLKWDGSFSAQRYLANGAVGTAGQVLASGGTGPSVWANVQAPIQMAVGSVHLSGGAGSHPFDTPFTAGSVVCLLTDATSGAAPAPVPSATLTAISVTGNGNDTINYQCFLGNQTGGLPAANYNGTVVGSPTFAAAKFGNGLTAVSDTNYISLPAGTFDFNAGGSSYSYEAQLTSTTSSGGPFVAISFSGSDNWLGMNGGVLSGNIGGSTVSSSKVIADGVSHHTEVDMTSTGNYTVFVDGVVAATGTGTVSMSPTSGYIGRYTSPGYAWPGSLDEVAIWNAPRHAAAFTPPSAAYTGYEPSLRALYHLQANGQEF